MNYSLSAEQQELVEQHLDLVSIIIRKYIRTNEQVRGLEYEDLFEHQHRCFFFHLLHKRFLQNLNITSEN